MDRIMSRLLLKRQVRILPIRCYCDKKDKPPEISNKVEVQQPDKSDSERSNFSKESAMDKINLLLNAMVEENNKPRRSAAEDLSKPPGIFHKPKRVLKDDNIEEKLIKAASDVAESMGENKKQVEAKLLSKVLGKINPSPSQVNLNDLIGGMKVDREKSSGDDFKGDERAENARQLLPNVGGQFKEKRQPRGRIFVSDEGFRKQNLRPTPKTSDNLFGSAPLNIFKSTEEVNYGTKLDVWNAQFEKELKLSVQRHPDNYFEKMILWTDEGKIWKFPIDNEQGLEEDQKVPFTDHIFLDVHLEGWCPETGAVRHFMELVCVGLSKNPYYTVQEKIDHINWFRDFFMAREELLKEVGAFPPTEAQTETVTANQ